MMNCRAMMHLENYLLEHIVKQYKKICLQYLIQHSLL